MIVGAPGSGKSTLAQTLGARTGLPVYHMDREVHWLPGWVERRRDEKTQITLEIAARADWIFEGGHSVTYEARVARADTLIWLDLPVGVRYGRVVWRTLRTYGRSRPDLPDACPEHFDPEFYRFIWRTRNSGRAKIAEIVARAHPGLRVLHFRSGRAVRRWLRTVPGRNA